MNRQNIIEDTVKNFTSSNVRQQLIDDPESFFRKLESFSCQNLTLKMTNIDLDRKTLHSWRKAGLLPYSTPVKEGKGKAWGRYSFFELCWIRLLMEMRNLGLGLDKLQEVKKMFFDDTKFLQQLFSIPIQLEGNINPEYKERIEARFPQGISLDGEAVKTFEGIQFSKFSYILMVAMLKCERLVFWGNGSGKFDVYSLEDLIGNPQKGFEDLLSLIGDNTSFFLNITRIITELSNTHSHFSDNTNLKEILGRYAANILNGMFRKGNVSEVTIVYNETGAAKAHVKSRLDPKEFGILVEKLKKKGAYCDITIKTRDGQIQFFEKIDIYKL